MARPARNVLHFPRRKPRVQVGCHADHNPAHLAFLRHHTGEPPMPTPPMRPILADIRDAALLLLFMGFVLWITGAI